MANLIHGGDIYSFENRNILDFSANINPLGLPENVKKEIANNLEACEHYPDPLCRKLIQKIAIAENVRTDQIISGNGAADIIFRLALALHPKKALVSAPTFAEYEIAVKTVNCEVEYYRLLEENGFELGTDISEKIRKNNYDIVFICNPNNPTGKLTNTAVLEDILNACEQKGSTLIVDECFLEFCENCDKLTLKPYINSFRKLVILKAFTKIYAMPGLRLGYAITSDLGLIENLKAVSQPWAVSQIAQIAGVCALDEKEYVVTVRRQIQVERAFLVSELNKLGIKTYDSAANYLLLNIKDSDVYDSDDFQKKLLEFDILVRSCGNYVGLDENYFRIAIRNHIENSRLIEALKSIYGENGRAKWQNQ